MPAQAQSYATRTHLLCDRGVKVPATYVIGPDDDLVVIDVDGRQQTLLRKPSALGARYSLPSDGSVYVGWSKDDGATLLWKTLEGEVPVLSCVIP
ncbi:MAG: lysozyme inhibitor [Rhodobacteraceae bacterium]|nr:lysozyme inhibitor [Paracoccaceae bacterium]